MSRRSSVFTIAALAYVASLAVVSARQTTPATQTDQAKPGNGWTLPPTAAEEKNPLAADATAVAAGRELFGKNCQRCHGPGAKGDGPDADPDLMQDMDLTVARRAARNPDGVVFFKVWNGRSKPKMPAFGEKLTKDQVWQIVSYVQTLREKP